MFPNERDYVPGKEKCSFTSKTTLLEGKHNPRPGKHRLCPVKIIPGPVKTITGR
jgi:hypothetical protein